MSPPSTFLYIIGLESINYKTCKKYIFASNPEKRTQKQAQNDKDKSERHKMDYLTFSEMRMRKHHLFCTGSHHTYRMKNNKSSTRGLSLEMNVLARARAQLLNILYISTHLIIPHGENI